MMVIINRWWQRTVVPDTSNVTGLGAPDPSSNPRCLRISLCELPCTQLPGYFMRRSGRLAYEVGGECSNFVIYRLGKHVERHRASW